MKRAKKDLTGHIYGKLTVIYEESTPTETKWRCKCKCGKETTVLLTNLQKGTTKSCGCSKGNKKHGYSKSKDYLSEYNTWCDIKQRCYNKNCSAYNRYGGRGIKICDRWLHSFENFLEDMGKKPDKKLTIERLNVNGDYCPENCVWETMKAQARNRTNSVWHEYNGDKRLQTDWASFFGVDDSVIISHLKLGKSFKEIYEHYTRTIRYPKNAVILSYNGVEKTRNEWSKILGVDNGAIQYYLNKGWQFTDIYNHFINK